MVIALRLAALRLACAELRKFVTTRAQSAGLFAWRLRGGLRAGHDAGRDRCGHAGWQPACTRTGVGPEHRLSRPETGGTR
jgi:hypothetical protein